MFSLPVENWYRLSRDGPGWSSFRHGYGASCESGLRRPGRRRPSVARTISSGTVAAIGFAGVGFAAPAGAGGGHRHLGYYWIEGWSIGLRRMRTVSPLPPSCRRPATLDRSGFTVVILCRRRRGVYVTLLATLVVEGGLPGTLNGAAARMSTLTDHSSSAIQPYWTRRRLQFVRQSVACGRRSRPGRSRQARKRRRAGGVAGASGETLR